MHNVLVIAMNQNRKIKRTVIVHDSKKGVRKQNCQILLWSGSDRQKGGKKTYAVREEERRHFVLPCM